MEDPHLPSPNWAEITVAGLTAVSLLGGGLLRYLVGRIANQALATSKKLAEQRIDLENKLAAHRFEITQEMVTMRSELSQEIAAESRNIGESLQAIRTHVGQVELWVRDNLVRRDDFKSAVESLGKKLDGLSDKMDR